MLVKVPPAYTVVPLMASAETELLAFGFQAIAFPVVASNAAIYLRLCPPMLVKVPPAYTVVPLTASEMT
jgi:hypothetical protein